MDFSQRFEPLFSIHWQQCLQGANSVPSTRAARPLSKMDTAISDSQGKNDKGETPDDIPGSPISSMLLHCLHSAPSSSNSSTQYGIPVQCNMTKPARQSTNHTVIKDTRANPMTYRVHHEYLHDGSMAITGTSVKAWSLS